MTSATQPVVTTTSGPVRGRTRDGVTSFLGIPYAASPTGDLRFAAPAPPGPWSEIRDADAFGPTPPKPPYPAAIGAILHETEVPGDDYLNLNVWTPDVNARELPVMVWVHGGAFVNGNSSLPTYGGQAFARDGVVLVTINYRLGVDGFTYLADAPAPANRGLLDQIAAFEWVRDNIAAFGGDPGNVTAFGESAGAMSVTTLIAMPAAAGLFTKAITQSGAVQAAASIDDARLVTAELAAALGIEPTAANLAAVDIADLTVAQRGISDALALGPDPTRFGASIVASSMPFIPVVDGDTLPEHPLAAIAAGAGAEIAILTGTNTDEHRLFLVPSGFAGNLTAEIVDGVAGAMGMPAAAVERYRANRSDAPAGDVFVALLTDVFFRLQAFSVAAAHAGDTWMYEFAWPSPASDLRAAHAMEIPFVFDALAVDGSEVLVGPAPPQSLADAVHGDWVRFAATGDPGWPIFDGGKAVMVYTATGGEVGPVPRADEVAVWSAV